MQLTDYMILGPQRFMSRTSLVAAQGKRRAIGVRLRPDAQQLVNKGVKSCSTNLYAGRSADGSPVRGLCKDCTL